MTVVLALVGYAILLATIGAWALRRARWVDRAPRLAVGVWQALVISVVLAVVFAAVALMVPMVWVTGGLADLLAACAMALRAKYGTPAGTAAGTAGMVLLAAVAVRLCYCLVAEFGRAARWRRDHRDALDLIGHRDTALDAVVVDHAAPAAYCLAGRRRRVVLTSAALETLDSAQVTAVLGHERAHLRARHHIVVGTVMVVALAFPRVPAFTWARDEIARLVELAADDAAIRGSDRLIMAEALLRLGGVTQPQPKAVATLAAAGNGVSARVRRLIGTRSPLGRGATAVGMAGIALLLILPFGLAAAPAAAATHTRCCPGDAAGLRPGSACVTAMSGNGRPCAVGTGTACRTSGC